MRRPLTAAYLRLRLTRAAELAAYLNRHRQAKRLRGKAEKVSANAART